MKDSTVTLSCCLDDWVQLDRQQHHWISSHRQRQGPGKLSLGEMLLLMVLFPPSPDKDFKHFCRHGNKSSPLLC